MYKKTHTTKLLSVWPIFSPKFAVFWMSISWRHRIYWHMDILRCMDMFLITKILDLAYVQNYMGLHASLAPLCLLIVKTRRATINQHPLPGKDHHHQNSAETQKGEGCKPPYWPARPGGFGTTAFRPQQAQRTHAKETKKSFLPQRVPVVRRTRQPSMFFRDVTDTNQRESHSGHQQLRFTRNYMGA